MTVLVPLLLSFFKREALLTSQLLDTCYLDYHSCVAVAHTSSNLFNLSSVLGERDILRPLLPD